jgi:hypothetical protein
MLARLGGHRGDGVRENHRDDETEDDPGGDGRDLRANQPAAKPARIPFTVDPIRSHHADAPQA